MTRSILRLTLATFVLIAPATTSSSARAHPPGSVAAESARTAQPRTEHVTSLRAPTIRSAVWLNSAPLSSADLRGKVVLVEFWAFDCINCRRTLPAMRALYSSYRDSGVVVIGVHTPELDQERRVENVKRAVSSLGVRYPVAIDGDYAIWRAFGNQAWPALYVIDKRGVIRSTHVGELHLDTPEWDHTVALIQRLRREPA